ncbi:MAG: dTDP-4-dehydrorhamnose reductase [Thermotogota bacterium]
MKFLITGSNGQLGREFQNYFNENKINHIPTTKEDFDITNIVKMREFLNNYKRITHIINCAAYTDVDKAERDWNKAYEINTVGVKNIVKISNEINTEIIHFSTDYVFSGDKGYYKEKDTPDPINKYGKSKELGEREIKKADNFFLIRTSWLFGKEGENFPKKVIGWAKESDNLKITTDEISSPTYTVDLVKATLELINTNQYGTYHITNSSCTRYEWAEYILNKIRWEGKIKKVKREYFDLPAKRPKNSVLDNAKYNKITKQKLPNWKNATERFLKEIEYI